MHKDPPPTFFDPRRPLVGIVTHGLIAGFLLALVSHFAWTLWRQNSSGAARADSGRDALVKGIVETAPERTASPAAGH